jgi:hypothetical protein
MPHQTRKEKSEAYLQTVHIPINRHLPSIESEDEVELRKARDVAKRCLALNAVCAAGFGIDRTAIVSWLQDEALWASLSETERAFLESASPTQPETVQATWRVEYLWILLWSLGQLEQLDLPNETCDVDFVVDSLPGLGQSTAEFVREARLIALTTILDEADLIYRIHWAVRDAQLNQRQTPANLNAEVVQERHHTLNWLIGTDEDWEDVSTDT